MKQHFITFLFLFVVAAALIATTDTLQKSKLYREQAETLKKQQTENTLTVVLSPHLDDAVLSLGGLLAKEGAQAYVLSFFTGDPQEKVATVWDTESGFTDSHQAMLARVSENKNAVGIFGAHSSNYNYLDHQYRKNDDGIQKKIEADIEAFLALHSNTKVNIYGPAEFGPTITHPDHQLLHDSFVEVAKIPHQNVSFFIYEDFPYTTHFIAQNMIGLKPFLETQDDLTLQGHVIYFSDKELREKLQGISAYSSQVEAFAYLGGDITHLAELFSNNRCAFQSGNFHKRFLPCEVVYQILPTGL